MSGAGTDRLTGRPAQWTLRSPRAAARAVMLLGAVAAASGLRFAWDAGLSAAWPQLALAAASLLALTPLPGLVRELRRPLTLLPAQHRGEPLRASLRGETPAPVIVKRLLDGGGWLLVQVRPVAPGPSGYRCLSRAGLAGTEADDDALAALDTAWAALRRELVAAEARRSEP